MDLLTDIGFLTCKPASTPIVPSSKSSAHASLASVDPHSYRRLIGKLLYLCNTRPDISYAVHHLSQFLGQPTTVHLQALHRILRYLKGSPGQGLFFSATSPLQLKAYSDSDWAACPETRVCHWVLCFPWFQSYLQEATHYLSIIF